MIVRDDLPDTPDWHVNPKRCDDCHGPWHTGACELLLAAGIVLGEE